MVSIEIAEVYMVVHKNVRPFRGCSRAGFMPLRVQLPSSEGDATDEGVVVLEEQFRFRGDPGSPGDCWADVTIWGASYRAFEGSAENSFLDPNVSGREFAVGVEAGHLGAGPGAAG